MTLSKAVIRPHSPSRSEPRCFHQHQAASLPESAHLTPTQPQPSQLNSAEPLMQKQPGSQLALGGQLRRGFDPISAHLQLHTAPRLWRSDSGPGRGKQRAGRTLPAGCSSNPTHSDRSLVPVARLWSDRLSLEYRDIDQPLLQSVGAGPRAQHH